MTVILSGETHWECPNCDTQDVCSVKPGQVRMHNCPGLKGLTAPLVPAGTKCKVETTAWEDYVRHDFAVRKDEEGKPVSAINITREDGNDVIVFPSAAVAKMEF
jgi:hypothetical protein